MRRLVVAVALVCASLTVPARPADAASAAVCAVDGFLNAPSGIPVLPVPPGSGGFNLSSVALVCGGTLLGTGIFSGAGTFLSGPGIDFTGNFTMTVGSTTCAGPFTGISNRVEFAFFVSTGCGAFTIFGVGVPTGVNGMPAVTQYHLTGVGVILPSGVECSWASGSGCSYIAHSSSATAFVVSPTQPAVAGGSAGWTQIPVVGTGTNGWLGSISHAVGASVTVAAAPNTSGVVVST